MEDIKELATTCCIVGGGPAGMMLGYLLARSGVAVMVLEKHVDFFRDFRGDTIHPSTLQIMYELGLLDKLLELPHQKVNALHGFVEDHQITVADFSKLKVHCPYVAFMPQWDFLNFLYTEAKKYHNFTLLQQCAATDLIYDQDKVVGVIAATASETLHIHGDLVVAADGRSSTIRACSKLPVQDLGAPMDVFWFKISRKATDPNDTFGKFSAGKIFVVINRNDYWQCGYVIAKGEAQQMQQQDIDVLRQKIATGLPFLADRVNELKTWDDAKLLTVKIDRLKQWYRSGLLCIGDAAHAMSPVGGVGINLAIQDAVAAANILAQPLKNKTLSTADLAAVQQRRLWPVTVIQKLQCIMQSRIIYPTLLQQKPLQMPWLMRKIQALDLTHHFMGWLIGIGVRAEKVKTV